MILEFWGWVGRLPHVYEARCVLLLMDIADEVLLNGVTLLYRLNEWVEDV